MQENRERLDKSALIEYGWPFASKEEKGALRWLNKPVTLKSNQTLPLTHHKYRGPWHIERRDPDSGQLIRTRDGGPTPTRFVICSPNLLQQQIREDEKIIPPYRGKPIVLKRTEGIRIRLELGESDDVTQLWITNRGTPLEVKDLPTMDKGGVWPQDALYRTAGGIIAYLAEDHKAALSTREGTTVFLTGGGPNQFTLSFSVQGRDIK